jgi:hypothetical protein
MHSAKLLLHFIIHIIVAAVLFSVVAGVAYGLWFGTQWLKQQGVPDEFYLGVWAITELLFWLDVLCFVVFVSVEVWQLLCEITHGLRGAE